MANNKTMNASIYLNGGDTYRLENSIIYEPIVGTGATITGISGTEECLVLNNDSGFNRLTDSIVGNPIFFDEINHDYHLMADSPAIDLCEKHSFSLSFDIDGDRIWDDPNIINAMGFRDAGADESMMGDVIFLDSF